MFEDFIHSRLWWCNLFSPIYISSHFSHSKHTRQRRQRRLLMKWIRLLILIFHKNCRFIRVFSTYCDVICFLHYIIFQVIKSFKKHINTPYRDRRLLLMSERNFLSVLILISSSKGVSCLCHVCVVSVSVSIHSRFISNIDFFLMHVSIRRLCGV